MWSRLKRVAAEHVERLPHAVTQRLIRLNRNPEWVYGGAYRDHRRSMCADDATQATALLLASVNRAIQEIEFYRARYCDKRIETLHEFENTLEFIDRTTVMQHRTELLNPYVDSSDYEMCSTGGTSGPPLLFEAPKRRYAVEWATMHALWERSGYDFDVRAVIRNHHLRSDERYRVNPITREVIFDGFRLADEDFAYVYSTLQRLKIRFVHCYPSTAFEFARFIERNHLDPRVIRAFLSGSETVFPQHLHLIQDQLGIRFYSWYGHSEKLVLAGYCAHTNDYHAEPLYGHVELIDDRGQVIREPGQIGEITGTALHNPRMPFLRYKTGDYAEYVGDQCAACRRRVTVFRNVCGRWKGARIYRGDGTFVTTTALNLHTSLNTVVKGLQYIQERRGELTVLLIKSSDFTPQHEATLQVHLRHALGPEMSVSIRYADRLQRKANGKFAQLISSIESS